MPPPPSPPPHLPHLPTTSPTPITIIPEPLTAESFSPFGTVIACPLPRDLSIISPSRALLSTLPTPHPPVPPPVLANQSTALKYSPISPLLDNYTSTAPCPSGRAASARMSLFACFPRRLRPVSDSSQRRQRPSLSGFPRRAAVDISQTEVFDVTVLERHPYTTQSFIPLGLSPSASSSTNRKKRREEEEQQKRSRKRGGDDTHTDTDTVYLVIVAPSRIGEKVNAAKITTTANGVERTVTVTDPPDLEKMRAFVATDAQAVTYGAGTWHAPMVVLGKRRVDFVVVQFVNGVEEEDCQEVMLGRGEGGGGVVVDLGRKGQYGRAARKRAQLWSKL